MALRIRTIKPEWLDDARLSRCSDSARLMSIALITLADDFGCGRADIEFLASRIWYFLMNPHESLSKAHESLSELIRIEYIKLYKLRDQYYFSICNWDKHQKVQHPARSRHIPAPEGDDVECCLDVPSINTIKSDAYHTSEESLMNPHESLSKAHESLSNPHEHTRVPGETLMTDLDLDLDQEFNFNKKNGNQKKLSIRNKIQNLEQRYQTKLIQDTRSACALSRRNGEMSDPVWLRTLEKLDHYSVHAVETAALKMVEHYADGSKDERYFIAIAKSEHARTSGSNHTNGGMIRAALPNELRAMSREQAKAKILGMEKDV